jgi:hypothetical protein
MLLYSEQGRGSGSKTQVLCYARCFGKLKFQMKSTWNEILVYKGVALGIVVLGMG